MRWCLGLICLVLLASCAPGPGISGADRATKGRHAYAQLYLGDTGPAANAPPFRFSGLGAAKRTVALVSLAAGPLRIQGRCEGALWLVAGEGAGETLQRLPPAAEFAFTLPPGDRGGIRLQPDAETRRCTLTVRPRRGGTYGITLEREDLANPALAELDGRRDICALPDPAGLNALERAFYAPRALSIGCVLPPGRPQLLPDARDGFNAKVEALTGARLADAALDAGDPMTPLDFSKAPELDLIWISYLNMRADFSGYLMARMLEYHAARGTTVRILLTSILMLPIDRAIFEDLAARYPNVQLQLYSWRPNGAPALADPVNALHRDQHIKAFAVLARDPSRSRILLGGRNLTDPWLFDSPRDLSAYPFLRNYKAGRRLSLTFFLPYEDFEIAFADDTVVRALLTHLASFWHRDHDTQRPRAFAAAVGGGAARGGMRHFISVPFTDGRAQEALFVELFDAARESIVLTAPFLNLTEPLDSALRRARARGVAVQIVARTQIDEPAGVFSIALNRLFFEAHADWLTIIGYDPAPRTLHTKLLVIDGRLSLVTSTNMNRRSFLHDTENGVMILDRGISARLLAQIATYRRRGAPVAAQVQVAPLLRLLMSLPALRNAF